MAITYTPARQRTFTANASASGSAMADVPMEIDCPSRGAYMTTSNDECPRKRTHYEANADMDWEPHMIAAAHISRPSAIFANATSRGNSVRSGDAKSPNAATGGKYSSAFLSSAASKSPFLFPTSTIQDLTTISSPSEDHEPVASTSHLSSKNTDQVSYNNHTHTGASLPQELPPRDIAHGAVQRERRKRDNSKELQLVKGKEVALNPDNAYYEDEQEEQSGDDGDTSFLETLSFSAPIKTLFRRTRSSRHRNRAGPVHFSLHNHNYHWPVGQQDPFVFGAVTPSSQISNPEPPTSPQPAALTSSWLEKDTPYILLGYLQFSLNAALVLFLLGVIVYLMLQLRSDVAERVTASGIELQQEIMHCSSSYISNRCTPGERVPAMERQCNEWEFCMNRDPKVVNQLRVTAEVIAEVVNGFVESMTLKTMGFLLAILLIVVPYTNRTITTYRRQHMPSETGQDRQGQQQRWAARPKLSNFASAPPALEEIE